MIIQKVMIMNFRSIKRVTLEASDLNLFVGDNDAGKSNILKALNLFFNNVTDHGVSFDFDSDFSKNASVSRKKAAAVVIEVFFSTPGSYKLTKLIRWRKEWRQSSDKPHVEEMKLEDGSAIPSKSKAKFWLSQVRYRYVPAIKSNEYFSHLLGELYSVLSRTVDQSLKEASRGFVESIKDVTKGIDDSLAKWLGIESSIELPQNLNVLFEVLDFQTKYGGKNVSLKYRGDGIKV